MSPRVRGEHAGAVELADGIPAPAGGGGPPAALAEGHVDRGLVHMYLGEFDRAHDHLEEAVARYVAPGGSGHIYEAQGDAGVGALAYLAPVLWNLGYPDEAAERSDLSLERAERVGGPVTRAQAWGMRSILHLMRAEPVELGQWVHKTHAHSGDHDIGYRRTGSSLLYGWLRGRSV